MHIQRQIYPPGVHKLTIENDSSESYSDVKKVSTTILILFISKERVQRNTLISVLITSLFLIIYASF